MGTGTTEVDFNNTETLNGLEVWRKLSVPAAPRSQARRFALRDRVQQTKQCTTFAGVLEQLVEWKNLLTEYVLAGAQMPSDEDRRHSLLKMLPGTLSLEMRGKAHANMTFDDLEEWFRAQDEFAQDYGPKSVHVAEREAPRRLAEEQQAERPGLADEWHDEEPEEEFEELDQETLAVMSLQEINAFYRGRAAAQKPR